MTTRKAKAPRLAGEWAVFTQPDGPNTETEYLGCHDFGDIEKEDGDFNLLFCPGDYANQWDVVSGYQGEPSPANFDITTTIRKTRDVLQLIDCGVPFYLLDIPCGKKNVFTNWATQAIIPYPSRRTKRQWQGLAKRLPGDQTESTKVFSYSAEDVYEPYKPRIGRMDIAETAALLDVFFCSTPKCAGPCGESEKLGEEGAAISEAPSGSPAAAADIWHTENFGVDWAVANPGPFANALDAIAGVCFEIDTDTTRYVVARGTTNGAAMSIAYRDGTVGPWTEVVVGAVVDQIALGPQALFALDMNHIWLVTSGGYVYFSSDGAVTWTALHEATVVLGNLYAIHGDGDNMIACGVTDFAMTSTDGGESWIATALPGAGDDLISCALIDENLMWVGTDEANLYFTFDGGATWTLRAFPGSGDGGDVPDFVFANELVGYMIHNNVSDVGTVLLTINGGYNWQALATPLNDRLNALAVPSMTLAYAVGEPNNNTAVVLRIMPA